MLTADPTYRALSPKLSFTSIILNNVCFIPL